MFNIVHLTPSARGLHATVMGDTFFCSFFCLRRTGVGTFYFLLIHIDMLPLFR